MTERERDLIAKPPNAIGNAILSFEGDDAGVLGHAHLWFCQCEDESIPRHACSPKISTDPVIRVEPGATYINAPGATIRIEEPA